MYPKNYQINIYIKNDWIIAKSTLFMPFLYKPISHYDPQNAHIMPYFDERSAEKFAVLPINAGRQIYKMNTMYELVSTLTKLEPNLKNTVCGKISKMKRA